MPPHDQLLDLTGRTSVITGAAGGIGAAITRRLAGAGADVHLLDIDKTALDALAGQLRSAGVRACVRACAMLGGRPAPGRLDQRILHRVRRCRAYPAHLGQQRRDRSPAPGAEDQRRRLGRSARPEPAGSVSGRQSRRSDDDRRGGARGDRQHVLIHRTPRRRQPAALPRLQDRTRLDDAKPRRRTRPARHPRRRRRADARQHPATASDARRRRPGCVRRTAQ
jgi:hypothetical protein